MEPLAVLDDPAAAGVALDPMRSRLLALLAREPASAASLAAALDLPRQRVGYHLRQLADRGLVVEVGQRRHGGLTERLFATTAASFAIAPEALGGAGSDPERITDRLSAAYLVALAGRAVSEVGALIRGATAAGKQLPTLSIDTAVRFRTPADRAAFADELNAAVVDLVARYHDESAPDGRTYRLVTLIHPRPTEETP
ncbi:MAG: helix-turn-helix domain-containing protein [Acidimicrobiales bacterium]